VTYKVKGWPSFWPSLDAVADLDVIDEVYDIAFRIVEVGPDLPEAERTRIPFPPALVIDGWDYELDSVEGFLTYGLWGSGEVVLVSLTLYDWPDPQRA
jgi:hypothetical protein